MRLIRPFLPVLLFLLPVFAAAQSSETPYAAAIERAGELDSLKTLMVSQGGEVLVEEGYRGHSPDGASNIKSASKSVISALVGAAIERGVLEGVDQTIAPLLTDKLPADPDPRIHDITIGHLLSMQAGLERTSGGNYGAWVASDDWTAYALSRPFAADPGGPMLYSTGSTHLLSAILTRETGRSTLDLVNDWLGPAGIRVTSWERSPEGVYMGGNQMAMTTASLLALGELYLNEGQAGGETIFPASWLEASWTPRTRSRYTGEPYGYAWFMRKMGGHDVYYGWGYGGQMIYVVPGLDLAVAITSDTGNPSARSGYRGQLHQLVAREIIPAAAARRNRAEPQG